MVGTILLLILGIIMFIEAVVILLYPRKIKTIMNSLFKHHLWLQVIAIIEMIVGLLIIFIILF